MPDAKENKMTGRDRMRYTRIVMAVDAEVENLSSGEKRSAKTECVSMKGFFIDCGHSFPRYTNCNVTLFIGGHDSGLRVSVNGRVTFSDETGMGFEILSHISIDSYDHLHRLVLYNAAEYVDKVEDEIESYSQHSHFDGSLPF